MSNCEEVKINRDYTEKSPIQELFDKIADVIRKGRGKGLPENFSFRFDIRKCHVLGGEIQYGPMPCTVQFCFEAAAPPDQQLSNFHTPYCRGHQLQALEGLKNRPTQGNVADFKPPTREQSEKILDNDIRTVYRDQYRLVKEENMKRPHKLRWGVVRMAKEARKDTAKALNTSTKRVNEALYGSKRLRK